MRAYWRRNDMKHHGQALIEVPVFFIALSILLAGLVGFTQWFSIRQKLLLAAKQGALLYSSGHMKRAEVRKYMRDYLCSGSPVLDPNGIKVSVGPLGGAQAWLYELDQSVAQYTQPGGWLSLLKVDPTIVEKCVVKHAPHYGTPFQTLYGPPVSYGQ